MLELDESMHAEGYISAAEAAPLLVVGWVGSIHRMIKSGKLRGMKVRGTFWYVELASMLTSPVIEGVTTPEKILEAAPAGAVAAMKRQRRKTNGR